MKCPICTNEYMELQKHHIWPLEYGGSEDGPQVEICSTCHDNVHYQAENLMATTAPRRHFLTQDQLVRARYLLQAIMEAKRLSMGKMFTTARNMVVFSLDPRKRQLLHILKTQAGFKSLEAYLTALIDREISRL